MKRICQEQADYEEMIALEAMGDAPDFGMSPEENAIAEEAHFARLFELQSKFRACRD